MDYAPKASTASRLLARYGSMATLTRPGQPGVEFGTGGGSTPSQQTSGAAVILEYRQELLDGVIRKGGDRQLLLEAKALAFSPQAGDLVTHAGQSWRVEMVETLVPDGGTPILHTCQVRRVG